MKADQNPSGAGRSCKRLSAIDRFWVFLFWCSNKRQVRGLNVGILSFEDKAGRSLILAKLERALVLIAENSPHQYRRVRNSFVRLFVFRIPHNLAEYHPQLHMCVFDCEYLQATPPEELAMTIVHETTHAYLFRRGFGYDSTKRAQIERICVRAEIAFAKRLPGGAVFAHAAAERLNYGDDFWSDEAFVQRSLEALRTLNSPAWYIRWVERRARRKWKTSKR
jgi:hypothetical protein